MFELGSNTGSNRRTCRLTLIPGRAAELPSARAGALIGRVARFAELGAPRLVLPGAQSLVCMAKNKKKTGKEKIRRLRHSQTGCGLN